MGAAGTRSIAARLARLKRERPGSLFVPSPALRAFREDTAKRQCVLAANRVGKTYHAVEKLARRLIEVPGTRARICGPTHKQVVRTHAMYLEYFLRGHLAEGSTFKKGVGFNKDNLAILRNGSECELLNYRQEPEAHASSSRHIVLLDEPPPRWAFTEAESRVFDTDGDVWVTLTAVGRPVKWLREIVEAGVRDRSHGQEGWTFHQVAMSQENCPWYTKDQILRRIAEVARTPWEYRQRIEGTWDGVSEGRKFAAYTDSNLVSLNHGPAQLWPRPGSPIRLIFTVDHGDGPGHSVWVLLGYQVVKRDQYGTTVYIRALGQYSNEIRQGVRTEVSKVGKVLADLGLHWTDLSWAVGDINVATKSSAAKSLNESFEREIWRQVNLEPGYNLDEPPVPFRPASKGPGSVDEHVAICNQLFATEVTTPGGFSSPALQISEQCAGLHETLSHWGGADDDLKHAGDAFRYGVKAITQEVGWSGLEISS